jgi:high-affinity iron transporter
MLSTAIIIFRETLEIAMIIGIMLAATQGLANRMIWIVGGAAGGLLGAGLIAVLAKTISASLSGMGQEFFNALILFTAALLIGWTTLWVRANARTLKTHLHKAGQDLKDGQLPLYSLAIVIGLALLREGSEIVLFIYGMTLSSQSTSSIVAGTLLGLGFGSAAGVMLYYGLLKIPMRYMMEVISWLLIFMVAGLASQGVGHLLSAGFFSEWSRPIWDISWLLSNDSLAQSCMV